MSWKLTTGRLLDDAQLRDMHAAACEILARTGLEVGREDVCSEVTKHEGFSLRNGRICINRDRVEGWAKDWRPLTAGSRPQTPPGESEAFTYTASDRNTWLVERDGATVRPMTRDDVNADDPIVWVAHGQQKGPPAVAAGNVQDRAAIPIVHDPELRRSRRVRKGGERR